MKTIDMGDEDRTHFTVLVTLPIQVWLQVKEGQSYTTMIGNKQHTGKIMKKLNGGKISVRFPKPENMA